MSVKNIKIIEGKVERDYDTRNDYQTNHIDGDSIDKLFDEYRNENIRITIEVIDVFKSDH